MQQRKRATSAKTRPTLPCPAYNLRFNYSNPKLSRKTPFHPSPHQFRTIKVNLSLSVETQPLVNKKILLFEELANSAGQTKYIASKFPKGKPLSSEHQLVKQLFKFTDKFTRNTSVLTQESSKNPPTSQPIQKSFLHDEDLSRGLVPRLGMRSRHRWLAGRQMASRVKTTIDQRPETDEVAASCHNWLHKG